MTEEATNRNGGSGSGPTLKLGIVLVLVIAVGAVIYAKRQPGKPTSVDAGASEQVSLATAEEPANAQKAATSPVKTDKVPRLIDLGADKCIPCKMMAPILDELKKEYAGKMEVQFIDVWKNPGAGKEYGVQMIPTQIFYDASGEERFRHQGFFSKEDILMKWKELGVDLAVEPKAAESFSRWEPAQPDSRPKDSICYLCDGDIVSKTWTVMKTPAGEVAFCSPHCYIITFASITDEDKTHENASVTDCSSGELIPVTAATYLYGMDEHGRPTIKAFADEAAAKEEQKRSGGSILPWTQLEAKEMVTRCGFCDRPVYPEDASIVRIEGLQTWACCVMCALGVAARTGKDIELEAKDALTGDPIRVKTFEGHVAELEPPTAVAWGGARKDAEGNIKSTGCFKQAFFSNEANLKKWVEAHATATGRQMTIQQGLTAKMKLTPEQISKACKIGECTPK
ncbi:MAG: thioredoxin fold domain-containing protein [Nitrospiraceae bacterium]|nr:thioredoxin fold domain-containing protein [Nitrospiraceae bacterium]